MGFHVTSSTAQPGERTFRAPQLYVQGPGVLDRLGDYAAVLGRYVLLVVDAGIRAHVEDTLFSSCRAAGLACELVAVSGQVTRGAISTLVDGLDRRDHDVVVGVGGGKALDLAKGVAAELGARVVTCPTIASNDGPTAQVFALYDDQDVLCELGALAANPQCVLVDTAVIARAPARFLASGIGDALAKRFEARGCTLGTGLTTQGTRPLLIGGVVASACYVVLLDHAVTALADVGRGEVTPAVEATVEAVVLMSGIGYENGGLSIAHCMTRGLMVGRGSSRALHGFHVSYGLLVQLRLEEQPDALVTEVREFLRSAGLPVSLGELGMTDPTSEEVVALAEAARSAPHVANTPAATSLSAVMAAIRQVERDAAAVGPKS